MQATARKSLRQNTGATVRNAAWRRGLQALLLRMAPLLAVAGGLWIIAGMQWFWLWRDSAPDPVLPTALAAAFSVFATIRFWSARKSLTESFNAGKNKPDLEDLFNRLRGLGYRVFHDTPADGGNIEHVIVGTRGIYVVGTVVRSVPLKGSRRAFFDGKALSHGESPADESPVLRVKAQARQLRRLLNETAENDYPVRPVLLLPGWQVESLESNSFDEIWAMAPRDLPMWVGNQPEAVHGRDVRQIADALTGYMRQFR